MPVDIQPVLATDPVRNDPDDPAIWVNHNKPEGSLILGTNKVGKPAGALVVFGLNGKTQQTIDQLDRPNNVDVAYGFQLGDEKVDIAVLTERERSQLRVYRIASDGTALTEVGQVPVFVGEKGDWAKPMGIGLYQRARDGALFVIVGRKAGPQDGYLWQYQLLDDGNGHVRGNVIRKFGKYSGKQEVEAIAVDSLLGYVYYADERLGIRKYRADPDHPDAARELAIFGKEGFQGDHEGIAIYAREDGTGYIICTDQTRSNSSYQVFRREGSKADPHDHSELLKVVRGGADSTDGLETTSAALGKRFPFGILVAMNSRPKNFLIFDWHDVASSGVVHLNKGQHTDATPMPP
jgi:3-phytase